MTMVDRPFSPFNPLENHESAAYWHGVDHSTAHQTKKDEHCPCCRQSFNHSPHSVHFCSSCQQDFCVNCFSGHYRQKSLCVQTKENCKFVNKNIEEEKYHRDTCCCGKLVNSANSCTECNHSYCDECFTRHHSQPACEILGEPTRKIIEQSIQHTE